MAFWIGRWGLLHFLSNIFLRHTLSILAYLNTTPRRVFPRPSSTNKHTNCYKNLQCTFSFFSHWNNNMERLMFTACKKNKIRYNLSLFLTLRLCKISNSFASPVTRLARCVANENSPSPHVCAWWIDGWDC